MLENFAIAVIGLSFLAFPVLAFKVIYDDIKRDKKSKRLEFVFLPLNLLKIQANCFFIAKIQKNSKLKSH